MYRRTRAPETGGRRAAPPGGRYTVPFPRRTHRTGGRNAADLRACRPPAGREFLRCRLAQIKKIAQRPHVPQVGRRIRAAAAAIHHAGGSSMVVGARKGHDGSRRCGYGKSRKSLSHQRRYVYIRRRWAGPSRFVAAVGLNSRSIRPEPNTALSMRYRPLVIPAKAGVTVKSSIHSDSFRAGRSNLPRQSRRRPPTPNPRRTASRS